MTESALLPILDDWIWEILCEYPRYSIGEVKSIFFYNSLTSNFPIKDTKGAIYCPEHVVLGDNDIKIQARNAFLNNGIPIKIHFINGKFAFNDSL